MCRDINHEGRRCPGDTSEARRLRRHNAAKRAMWAAEAATILEGAAVIDAPVAAEKKDALEEQLKETISSIEEVHQAVASYNNLLSNRDAFISRWSVDNNRYEEQQAVEAWEDALSDHATRLGAAVEYLAETEHGAPTDADMEAEIQSLQTQKEERAALIANYQADIRRCDLEAQKYQQEAMDVSGINRDTHPVISEREAAWAAHPQAADKIHVRDVWQQRADESAQRLQELRATSPTSSLEQTQYPALFKKRAEAYKAALVAAGVQFADPQSLNVSEDSAPRALKGLHAALTYYPQTWVDRSNQAAEFEDRELRVKDTRGRAHYSRFAVQKKGMMVHTSFFMPRPSDYSPEPGSREEHNMEAAELKFNNNGGAYWEWTDEQTGRVERTIRRDENEQMWRVKSYNYRVEEPRNARGWEKFQEKATTWNPETGRFDAITYRDAWRKPNRRKVTTEMTVKAELTVSPSTAKSFTDSTHGFEVALHEYAHRSEYVVPGIAASERAFLRRRAGEEKKTLIYSGKNEVGYKDNFASHYMGKTYDGDAYEILSMGMETLFSGTNGGFTGAGVGKSADPDYKRFVLGLLATGAQDSGVPYKRKPVSPRHNETMAGFDF